MKVVTAAQMRRIDETAIRERDVAGLSLMERAGEALAREIKNRFEPESVAIVAGKGNNGGDGCIAARALSEMGVSIVLFRLFDPAEITGDAREAFERIPPQVKVEGVAKASDLARRLSDFDVVVDSVLGTGLRGPARGLPARAIEAINASGSRVVAVDIPSGMLSDDPKCDAPHVRASLTVTMGLPKLSLMLDPGARSAGVVVVADLGFPRDLLDDRTISVNLLDLDAMASLLPLRPPWGHKGTFGHVLILGGSEGMTGAAVLAARAAVRSGAGLIYSAYPRPLGAIMESHLVEPVKIPLAGRERWFMPAHAAPALRAAKGMQAVALGPGIGQRTGTKSFVSKVVPGVRAPLVIDADGLNLLASNLRLLRRRTSSTILTPHPGEAARLLRCSIEAIEADRLGACLDLAHDFGVVVVLKGSQTVITSPKGERFINPTGNSGLAKGGSGDVLTGLMTGLLAQGCAALDAAKLGVFLHGVAADRAVIKIGVRALTPSDVIQHLGEAFRHVEAKGASADRFPL